MEIRPILSALLRSKTGAVLVALQVAISLAILANAVHVVNLRQAVAARPSGMSDEGALFNIQVRHLAAGGHNEQLAAKKAELATLRAVAGVKSVALTSQLPMSQSGWTQSVAAKPDTGTPDADASRYFSPDSLVKTWGLKLVEGRDFTPADVVEIDQSVDDGTYPASVIVTRALAEKLWPGSAAFVGKTLYSGQSNSARVVGVLERLQTQSAQLGSEGEYSTISPIRMTNYGTIFTIRAEAGQRERVMKEAEAALRSAARTPVILRARTVDADRKERYRADVALAWMLVTVSVLLLLITASGIVGMASLWVTQRRKQIGVRRALGARRTDILRYFLTENFIITSTGVLGGVLLALGLNQLLVARLEMAQLPLGYLGIGAAVFWALGVVAVVGPAWRAASISPALATRSA